MTLFPKKEMARAMIAEMVRRREQMAADAARRHNAMIAEYYGIRLPVKIPVCGVLNDHSEKEIRSQLARAWNASEIRLEITSPGGSLMVAENICDDLRQLAKPVTAHVTSLCASAAIRPLLSATWRTAAPRARFVLHGVSMDLGRPQGPHATASELRRMADYADRKTEDEIAFLRGNLRLTDQMVATLRKKDLLIEGNLARAVGLVHAFDPSPLPPRMQMIEDTWANAPQEAQQWRLTLDEIRNLKL